MKKCEK